MVSSTIESFPNELFIELFRYFQTPDLFHSFYNLNHRFNTIIQSLTHLHLTISKSHPFLDLHPFSPFIRSLIIIDDIDINLEDFPNLHRLILHHPSCKFLKHLETSSLPYLEHLAIPHLLFGMSSIFSQIFSPRYPQLKLCFLFGFETIETIQNYTQTNSLRILKIGLIDFHVYKVILSSCPNLNFFQLKIFQSYLKLSDIYSHGNLKKLNISTEINDWRYNDQLLDCFLACVPNLEQLNISRTMSITKLVELIPDYDWFASIISFRLPYLQYLIVRFYFEYHSEFIEFISAETRRELRKDFLHAHQNRYRIRLIIK